MPHMTTNAFATPFGRNEFLRSTKGLKYETFMVARETVPYVEIDGHPGQKVLQAGVVMALITSGPDEGLIGPFQAAGTAEVHTFTEATAITAGTFTMTVLGETTTAIQHDAVAATVQAAVRAAVAASDNEEYAELADSLTVTGGPIGTTPLTLTFAGAGAGDVPASTVDVTALTGTITVATGTPGVAGATDGRQTVANIVGINDTFLPWQLVERNVEVGILVAGTVVQANCIQLGADGVGIPCDDTTAAGMFAKKSLDIHFTRA